MEILVISILVISYLIDTGLTLLNVSYKKNPIPENVKDLYEPARYKKWMNYTQTNTRFGLITSGVNLLVLLTLLLNGGSIIQVIYGVSSGFENPLVQTLIFLGIYQAITFVIGLGFSSYRTFVIEEKFGFNKTTPKVFVSDKIKQILLTVILGGAFISGLYFLFEAFQDSLLLFVIILWLSVMIIFGLLSYLYTAVFVKIFYKIEPIEEGTLRTRIESLAEEVGFKVKAISKLNASKRSSKMNAFFSGFGKQKEIVFFDTLLDKMGEDEILAVLAHEFAHGKHKDVQRNFIQQFIMVGLFVFLIYFILTSPNLYTAFGFEEVFLGFGIILFSVLGSPLSFVFGIPTSYLSRKAEYKADAFAVKMMGQDAMASALKILARDSLSDLNPHPLYVRFNYSHPPMHLRLGAIEKKTA
jgi:STE24 endopeptidase